MTSPRFDDRIKYLIPSDLYADIISFVGLPQAALLIYRVCKVEVWLLGSEVKSLLDMLHRMDGEMANILGSELYAVIAEPEPEGNDGQDILQ